MNLFQIKKETDFTQKYKNNARMRCKKSPFALTFFAIILSLCTIYNGFAVLPDEVLDNPVLEARARALSFNLRCLVCQNETIDESLSLLARDLRLLIREKLQAGENEQDILTFITARYGEFVLLRPTFTHKTAALWLAPLIILTLVFGFILVRWRRQRSIPFP